MKTKEELEKCRVEMPAAIQAALAACEGCDFSLHEESDEYGHYSTGLFRYKGKDILITIDEGMWHVSINANHPIGYYELKDVRYQFVADHRHMAQIFPPREEFVNISENCFHLYELAPDEIECIDDIQPQLIPLKPEPPTFKEVDIKTEVERWDVHSGFTGKVDIAQRRDDCPIPYALSYDFGPCQTKDELENQQISILERIAADCMAMADFIKKTQ